MHMMLHVYMESALVGYLAGESENYSFIYAPEWLNAAAPLPLSLSLPLQAAAFDPTASKAFFSNLLPEGQLREHFTRKHRLAADDELGLLAALGGDCAGALALYPGGADFRLPPPAPVYRSLSSAELEQLLDEAFIMDPSFLGADEQTRLSLAGVQDKLPVAVSNGSIRLPLAGAPSTHILKPQNPRFASLVENEAFCMTLANAMGLTVPRTVLLRIGEETAYLIERYDRRIAADGSIRRIHQEDFCQANGRSWRQKYERSGGPGQSDCFQVVGHCRNPLSDRIRLLELVIFNVLIGNADAHAKNLSLLYDHGANPSLAPFYDLVCTAVYPHLSTTLAMGIGEIFDPRALDLPAWCVFAEQTGAKTSKPVLSALQHLAGSITERATAVAGEMEKNYGGNPIYARIVEVVEARAGQVLRQFNH